MATVYVSSTRRDLDIERRRVLEWLADHGHERRHSYVADSDTVRESCVRDVVDCDAYVLILGHRYGFVPADANPNGFSITEMEYDAAAGKDGMPVIVLKPSYIAVVSETDIGKPVYTQVLTFHAKVSSRHRPAEFKDEAALVDALSLALERALARPVERSDVQAILRELTRVASESAHKDTQIEALRRELAERTAREAELQAHVAAAVARTIDAADSPDATPAQVEAAEALRAGDAGPASELLREDERAAAVQIEQAANLEDETTARKAAAARARERGALALQTDVATALEAYSEAAAYEPEDVWTWLFVGDMHKEAGDLSAALAAYRRAHELTRSKTVAAAEDLDAARDLSVSQHRLGDVHVEQGDLAAALEAYEASLAIAARLAARDPANTDWQRNLSVSHDRLGVVHVAQDNLPAALQAFEASLAIRERLAARDPTNTEWQRDLSVSHNSLGDVHVAQGDHPAALREFEADFAIAERLAAGNPVNTEWQRDLSVSHNKLGDVHVVQGDLPAALEAFEAGLVIAERLATRDPVNTSWQRDLSISHDRLGDVHVAQSNLPAALQAFEASLAIRERLAARDPANTLWQLDLVVSYGRIAGLGTTPADRRRDLLHRGFARLEQLASENRLLPNEDRRRWFKKKLRELDETAASPAKGSRKGPNPGRASPKRKA